MAYCLLPEKVKEFKRKLKEKEINIADLLNMTTEARIKLLEEYAGKDAPKVNRLFEEKLVLKNRILGIKNWASKVAELGKYDPAVKAEIDIAISEFKAKQQERILKPKEDEAFYNSLADKIVGAHITKAEAATIFDLTSKNEEFRKGYDEKTEQWSSEEMRSKYAENKVALDNYINFLKEGKPTLGEISKRYGSEIAELWKEDKPTAVKKILADSASEVANNLTSFVATLDNSFIGRQGAITLIKNPKVWWNMVKKSFSDIGTTFKGSSAENLLRADIVSRPNSLNGNYETAKLFPKTEEQFPANLPERIPGLGRVFKASEVAFKNSAIRARADLFDMIFNIYKKTGQEVNKTMVQDIGTHVNAITARGKLGQVGTSKVVQLTLWAPKMLKADWDILTGHTLGAGLKTKFARKQALKTSFGAFIAMAGVTAIADAMGAQVEKDPRSSEFLKIRVGNTTFNNPFGRGMPQIMTLVARLISGQTKDARTQTLNELNTGEFGSKTLFDVGLDFLVNKTNPVVRTAITLGKGRDISGKKPTPESTMFGLTPISFQNLTDLKDEASTQSVIGAIADLVGLSSNTYQRETDWSQSEGAELTQFKEKVGEDKFNKANEQFNDEYNAWLRSIPNDKKYLELSNDEKKEAILKKKQELKKKVFDKYDFKYKRK